MSRAPAAHELKNMTEKKETLELNIHIAFDNDYASESASLACNILHTIATTTGELENIVKGALAFCAGALRALERQETTIAIFENNAVLKKGEVIAEKYE